MPRTEWPTYGKGDLDNFDNEDALFTKKKGEVYEETDEEYLDSVSEQIN